MSKSVECRGRYLWYSDQNPDVPFTKAESETEEATMAYSYNRLWKLMIDKKINKTALRREAGITSNAMAKMGKDQPVSVEVLAKICRVLDCTVDDIIEILPDDVEETK